MISFGLNTRFSLVLTAQMYVERYVFRCPPLTTYLGLLNRPSSSGSNTRLVGSARPAEGMCQLHLADLRDGVEVARLRCLRLRSGV